MKVGDLLMLSTEEYSDYGYTGPYRVLKPFTFREILPLVQAQPLPAGAWREKHGPDSVRDFLEVNGYIETLEAVEVHLGSYGNIEIQENLLDA